MIIVAIIVMIMMMVVIACTLIEDAQMGVGRSWRKSEFAVPVILCFHSDVPAIGLFYKTCFWRTHSGSVWGLLWRNSKGFLLLISFRGCTTHFRVCLRLSQSPFGHCPNSDTLGHFFSGWFEQICQITFLKVHVPQSMLASLNNLPQANAQFWLSLTRSLFWLRKGTSCSSWTFFRGGISFLGRTIDISHFQVWFVKDENS